MPHNSKNSKYSKYEEVIIKSILLKKELEDVFFNDDNKVLLDWRKNVNEKYNDEACNKDDLLAEFIINHIFDNNKEFKNNNSFIPTNINTEIDTYMDRKFASKNEENRNILEEDKLDNITSNEEEGELDLLETEEI